VLLVAAAITPLVTALDQFGLDEVLKGSKGAFSQFVKTETLKRLAGKELTKDAIFAVTSKVFSEGLKRFGKTAGKIVATEVPTEAMQGAIQEAGIQLADKQEIDWTKLGYATEAEALGGFFGAGAMSVIPGVQAFMFNPTAYSIAMGTNNPEFAADLQDLIKSEIAAGSLTEEEAAEIAQNIEIIKETDKVIPNTVNNKAARVEAINLVNEKNRLKTEMEGMDPAMVLDKKERIGQIDELLTNISVTNLPTNEQTTNTDNATGAGSPNTQTGTTGSTTAGGDTDAGGQTPGANAVDNSPEAVESRRAQIRKDMEIEAFQERTGFKLYDPFEMMPPVVEVTLGRLAEGDTVDPVAIKEASDWLYGEYKRLDAMKQADNRTMTIPQIEEIQAELEGEIVALENEYNYAEQQKTEAGATVGQGDQQTEGTTGETQEVNGTTTQDDQGGEAATETEPEVTEPTQEGTGSTQEAAQNPEPDKLSDESVKYAQDRGVTAPHALSILNKYLPNWRSYPSQEKALDAAFRIRAAKKATSSQASKFKLIAKNPKLMLAVRAINRTFAALGVKSLILNDSDFNSIHESISGQEGSGNLKNAFYDPMTKTMYLKSSNIAQTAFHEVIHPFLDSIRTSNKEVYDKIVDRVRNMEAIKPDSGGKTYFEWAKYYYKDRSEYIQDEEAVTEFMADVLGDNVSFTDLLKSEALAILNDILKHFGYKGTLTKPVSMKFVMENVPNIETIVTKAVANSRIFEFEEAAAEGEVRDQIVGEKALIDEESTSNALRSHFDPDFKNTIEDKLSKFDEQIRNKKFPSALEVAEHVLPRDIFNRYKSLYEVAARNNITISNERLPYGMTAAWAFNNIQLNKDVSKYFLKDYQEFAETLNHEIIHGLISRGVRDNYDLSKELKGVMNQISSRFDSASDEVKNIISYIQDTANEFTDKNFRTDEETGSLEELITYAFTNKEFADFLDSIPASKEINEKGDSIFQQLKNIIRGYIDKIIGGFTALDEINSVVDKYFDTSFNEKNIAERNEAYDWNLRFKANEDVFDSYNNDPELISKAYHDGKKSGENTELIKAVEDLFSNNEIRDQLTPRRTLEENNIATAKEQEAIEAAANYMQDSADMDELVAEYAAKTDHQIETIISRKTKLTDEGAEDVFAYAEAINRAQSSPDRKFYGRTIPELMTKVAPIGTFAAKVLRFMQLISKPNAKAQTEALVALIENKGYVLSPAQKAELLRRNTDIKNARDAVKAAKENFLNVGTIASRELLEAEQKKLEQQERGLANLLSPMLPASFIDRFVANMQGNIQAIPSLGANLMSGVEAIPRAAIEAVIRGTFDLISAVTNRRPIGQAISIVGGSGGVYFRELMKSPGKIGKTLAFGANVLSDASARQYGNRVSGMAMYNAITNPLTSMRVPGDKIFKVFKTKDEIQIRQMETDIQGPLVKSYATPREAAIEAKKTKGLKAFGKDVHKMIAEKKGTIVASYPLPTTPNQAQEDALMNAAEYEAYMLSTKPDRTHKLNYVFSQVSGITSEMLQRVSSATDNAIREPLAAARLTEEARRVGMTVDELLAYAALDETGEFSKYLNKISLATTYQQENKLAQMIAKFESTLKESIENKKNPAFKYAATAIYLLGKANLLFYKTPLNIVNKMVDVVLFGVPSVARSANSFKNYAIAKKSGNRIKADMYYSKAVGEFSAGVVSAMTWAAANYIVNIVGAVVGSYDSLDEKKRAMLKSRDIPLNSINLSAVQRAQDGLNPEWQDGDKIIPLRMLGMFGQALMFQASWGAREEKKEIADAFSGNAKTVSYDLLDQATGVLWGVPKQAFDASFMAGVNTLINVVNSGDGNRVADWSRGMTQALIAGFGVPATYSKAIESEYTPELVDRMDVKGTVENVFRYRTGLEGGPDDKIYDRVDGLGMPVKAQSEGNDPFQVSEYKKTPLWDKLNSIYEQSRDPKVIPMGYRVGNERMAEFENIETYRLVSKDVNYLNSARGAYRRVELEKLFAANDLLLSNGEYGTLDQEPDPKVKAKAVTAAMRSADEMFKPELRKYLLELSRKAGYPKLAELEQYILDMDEER